MIYTDSIMWKEINQTPKVLAGIRSKSNEQTIQAIAREVREKNVRNITGLARGTSDHAVTYFKYLTEIFSDIKVGLGACSITTVYGGKVNYGDNLVLGVSQSGKAVDVLEVMRLAKKQGSITVAVTNDCDSPMAKEAKYHVFCNCEKETSVAATKTFSAQSYIMLWLSAALSGNNEILNSLDKVSELAEKTLISVGAETDKLCKLLKSANGGFVLGRGISYPLALETALKLQETCYIPIKGYAESDFQHGPMAMVGKDTPIILYAPKVGFISKQMEDTHYEALNTTAKKLESFGGKIYIVTDDERFSGENVFKIPYTGNETLAFFANALFAQTLACKVSCAIGNNPDSPRALNKVTITK